MFEEVERVKKRRRERMEHIRTRTRDSLPPYWHELSDPVEDAYVPSPLGVQSDAGNGRLPGIPPQETLGVQVFLSLLLLGAAYLLFQTSMPLPASWKEGARSVMTRDFNFAGVAAWYESRFHQLPTVLPTITSTQKDAVVANARAWQMPQSWRVVKPFDPASTRMIVDVGPTGDVPNGEIGWVTYVGEKPGFGLTVVVQQGGGREVWYGNLERARVETNDWVKPGVVVGTAKPFAASSRYLYLAMREMDRFVDPMSVIPVD